MFKVSVIKKSLKSKNIASARLFQIQSDTTI